MNNYIQLAKTKAGVSKVTINVVRELADMLGNATAEKVMVPTEGRRYKTVTVVKVGLHGGKQFDTPKAAAEYLADSLVSLDELRETPETPDPEPEKTTKGPYYHLTKVSGNPKTGPIPVSTSSRDTCPDTCAFKTKGCYAGSGPMSWFWDKVTKGTQKNLVDWNGLCEAIKALPKGQLWRHNQAGDLPHTNGAIDQKAMTGLIQANIGKRGFTYTHHKLEVGDNLKQIHRANVLGFTVNSSQETLEGVDHVMAQGIPAVVVLPSDTTENVKTPQGITVVVCPATQRNDVTCASCKLCAESNRKVAVGFPAHGSQKKKVNNIIAAVNVA